ncbi:MAG: AAA family ATPase [Acidimicrobiia bacterium]
MRLVGGGKDQAPIRLGMSAEASRSRPTQDVGEAHEEVEAKYEGTDLTVAFNSPVPPRRHRHGRVGGGRHRVDRPAEAGGHEDTRLARLPLPADAGPDRLTLHLASLWLTDFRCYETADLRFPPGVTVICGANAQGKTSLLEAVELGRDGKVVPGGARRRARPHGVCHRDPAGRGSRRRAHATARAEIKAQGRNVQLNRHPLQRVRNLLGLMRITVFAPDDLHGAGEGWSRRPPRLPRRPPRGDLAPLRRNAATTSRCSSNGTPS